MLVSPLHVSVCIKEKNFTLPILTFGKHILRKTLKNPVEILIFSRGSSFRLNLANEPASRDGKWKPDSWKSKNISPTLSYGKEGELSSEIESLEKFSPLVFAGEVRSMHEQLARVCYGGGFLLMGGDNAGVKEELKVDHIRDTFRVILQMALVLTFGSAMPIIKIGHMAGQFNSEILAKGPDNNSFDMVKAYHQSAQTYNILRAFSTGGYADISRLQAWNLDFVEQTEEGSRYRKFAAKVDESLRFMKAIGVDTSEDVFTRTEFFTAHECILLPYDQALTRVDSTTGKHYDCSAHMLWVGEDMRELDGAHLEFVSGISNPLGVEISDKCTPDELIRICDTMNPGNTPGKLTIIIRMDGDKSRKNLPGLIRAVQREGKSVLWVSDPQKNARDFDNIRSALRAFFDVHDEMGSHPGGVKLQMTGEDVAECAGGVNAVPDDTNSNQNDTICTPRLNSAQSIEIAFLIAERMRLKTGLPSLG